MNSYEDLTDVQIIEQYKSGDEQAAEFLIEKYTPLVHRLSKGYFMQGATSEDLLQEGMIALFLAICSYNPQKNDNFLNFASMCIVNKIKSKITEAGRQKHKALNNSISMETLETGDPSVQTFGKEALGPEQILLGEEAYKEFYQNIDQILSEFEIQVMTCMIQEMPNREIAQRLGRTPKEIDNAKQRVKSKLKQLYE